MGVSLSLCVYSTPVPLLAMTCHPLLRFCRQCLRRVHPVGSKVELIPLFRSPSLKECAGALGPSCVSVHVASLAHLELPHHVLSVCIGGNPKSCLEFHLETIQTHRHEVELVSTYFVAAVTTVPATATVNRTTPRTCIWQRKPRGLAEGPQPRFQHPGTVCVLSDAAEARN